MFHQFDPKIRECLLTVAIEDAPATISTNREDLDKQQEAKRKKEEMIEKKSLDKAKEDLVDASYYWEMFHSEVCWKGNLSIVSKMLGRLNREYCLCLIALRFNFIFIKYVPQAFFKCTECRLSALTFKPPVLPASRASSLIPPPSRLVVFGWLLCILASASITQGLFPPNYRVTGINFAAAS